VSRLAFGGAEGQAVLVDGLTAAGTVNIDTSTPRSGAACFEFPSGGTNRLNLTFTHVDGRWFYKRAWIYFSANPSAAVDVLTIGSSTTVIDKVTLTTAGKLTAPDGTLTAALSTGWHCVELGYTRDASNNFLTACRIDGVVLGANRSFSSAIPPNTFKTGNTNGAAHAITLRMDDWALNDDQGSAQNSWPGTLEKILVALPSSDNAIGTDIKLGTGTTPSSNAFDAINNTPPLGVADATAGSDGKQLRDIAATTTEPASDADVNAQSYTTAGASAGATITATQIVGIVGHANATDRQSAIKLVSNPADAAETTSPTNTSGAGTFPTGWVRAAGAITAAPTVTLGTQPVLRWGKRAANSNATLCCFLGVYFGYEPATVQTVSPSAIASAEAFGTATLLERVNAGAIASAEAFGTPSLLERINAGAIASAGAFGTPTLLERVNAGAIASAEAFGTPAISMPDLIAVVAIASAEAFGTPTLLERVNAGAIGSAEAFGTPSLGLLINAGAIASGEAFGTAAISSAVLPTVVIPRNPGTLRWQIATLHYPAGTSTPAWPTTVLADLVNVSEGLVTVPKNDARTAQVSLSVYDPIIGEILDRWKAFRAAMSFSTERVRLEAYAMQLRASYLGEPVFAGPITLPEWRGADAKVTLHAVDHSLRLQSHFLVAGDLGGQITVSHGYGNLEISTAGYKALRDAALNLSGQTARGVPDLGIADGPHDAGSLHDPPLTVRVQRGDNIWTTWRDTIAGTEFSPDFSLDPVFDDPSAYALLNTYASQGSDLTSDVVFHYGFGGDNLADFVWTPGGKLITHVHSLDQSLRTRVDRADVDSSRLRGIYVDWHAAPFAAKSQNDTDALASYAEEQLAKYAVPPDYVTVTLKPDSESDPARRMLRPFFDFGIGDKVGAIAKRGYMNESLVGEISEIRLRQTDATGIITPEVDLLPVVGGDAISDTGDA
jgi:hypothetical protein